MSDIFINKPSICCISDIHIGVHQNSLQWHNITLEWAKWLADELRAKKIQDIVISGDFFHYRDEIAVNTIHFVAEILRVWKDFNIIMLVGNHDAYYKDKSDINSLSILDGWSNIKIVSEIHNVILYDKSVTFCPWGSKVSKIPDSDIIFGHFEIQTFKRNCFNICAEGIKVSDLLNKARLIISGHFHLRAERLYDDGTILYLGNPFQMDFGDVGSTKGYYILDLEELTYKFTENTISPKHKKIYLSELAKAGSLTHKIRSEFKNNFVKFVIDKNISPDEIDILLKKFTALNPISINVDYVVNFDKYKLDEDNRTDFSGIDIPTAIDEFVNLMDIKNKDEVASLTLELYKKCS